MSFNWGDLDWGSIVGSLASSFSTGKSKKGDINWNQIERLMDLDTRNNRFNRQGLFSGWDWSQDDQGNWTQSQTMNPMMQPGLERLMGRASQGIGLDPYNSPEQFSSLLDAKMADQMSRHGILSQNPDLMRQFGQPSASQSGQNQQPNYPQWQNPPIMNGQPGQNGPQPAGTDGGGGLGNPNQNTGGQNEQQLMLLSLLGQMGTGPNGKPNSKLGWQGEKGETGWDWLDNSGWNPATWRDDWNATDIQKLFGQKDIGSLGGLNAPEKMGKLGSWLFGIPGLGSIADKLFGYNPNKNYFSPVDPNNPYQSQGSGAGLIDDLFGPQRENLPNSPAGPDRGWSGRQQAYDPRGSITGGGAFNYATRLKMPTHSGSRAQG